MKLRIKELREDRDIKQKEIAKILNCKQNTYSQYENESRIIDIYNLEKLAIFYETSIDYLIGLTNETKPYPRIEKKTKLTKPKKECKEIIN